MLRREKEAQGGRGQASVLLVQCMLKNIALMSIICKLELAADP